MRASGQGSLSAAGGPVDLWTSPADRRAPCGPCGQDRGQRGRVAHRLAHTLAPLAHKLPRNHHHRSRKNGQPLCYKTGQFYLLPTAPASAPLTELLRPGARRLIEAEVSAASGAGPSTCAFAPRGRPASGPTPPPESTATSSTSSAIASAPGRFAPPSTRPAPSSPCRRRGTRRRPGRTRLYPETAPPPSPVRTASSKACSAPGSTPAAPPRPPVAQPRKALGGDGATLLVGEGIETVLSLVVAVPALHAAAALSAEKPRRLRSAPG